MACRPSRSDGFALIGALWLMVILSVVGLEFAVQARAMTARAIDASEKASARAAAAGCLEYARDVLADRVRQTQGLGTGTSALLDPWRDPGRLIDDTVQVGDARCVAYLEDAGARLNLNKASEADLRRLFTSLRIDASQADRMAQTLLDWRDPDDFRRARGAEKAEYVKARATVLPRNGPFVSLHEMRLVQGVTPELYRRVVPFLTVEGSGRVNLSSAPAEVIESLPGMSPELLALILRARRSGTGMSDLLTLSGELDPQAQQRLRANLPALLSRVTTETVEVLVRVDAWDTGGSVHAEAQGLLVRSGDAAFLVDRRVN